MLMGHLSWIRVIKKTLNEGIVYKLSKKFITNLGAFNIVRSVKSKYVEGE